MPGLASPTRVSEDGRIEIDLSLDTVTASDWISTEKVKDCRVLIVAEGVLQIQIRNGAGALAVRPPAVNQYWLEPTATQWGYMIDLVPAEFRLYNATGGTLAATVVLIPGVDPR